MGVTVRGCATGGGAAWAGTDGCPNRSLRETVGVEGVVPKRLAGRGESPTGFC